MLDLGNAERQYLARKGITGRQFDNMTIEEQQDWIEEFEEASYSANDKDYGTEGSRFQY